MTLGEKFEASGGRPAGFDYMRLLLAVSVVCWHTIVITYGVQFQDAVWATPKYRLLVTGILPAFFTLSGFLVAGSYERSKTVAGFLFLRVIRIFPALVVEIILSAFILGPLMTRLPLSEYFSDPLLFHYMLNCLGDIHFFLPGLFSDNPFPTVVNAQLWTIPFELQCYIALAVLAIIGVARRPKLFLLVVVAWLGIEVLHYLQDCCYNAANFSGYQLILCFLVGVLFFKFRAVIPYDERLAGVALLASLFCFLHPNNSHLGALPVAYVTIFLGLSNPKRMALLDSGDYSYGIFLYGFPIEQVVVATKVFPLNGWVTLLVALPLDVLVAVCSWHLCEKRMLALRRFRPVVDRVFGWPRPGAILKAFIYFGACRF